MGTRHGTLDHSSRGAAIADAILVRFGEVTNRTFVLPLLIFYPTSRCNSRCVSCEWWKQSGAGDLSVGEVEAVASALPSLGTRLVIFSGGEPLLRPEVFEMADLFRARGLTLHLLTSGVLLERFADRVAEHFERVVVSLDAASEPLYEQVRGVAALGAVERGVARLRRLAPEMHVSARATLHHRNFRELPRLIDHAKTMCLDGISFLAADVSSSAFGRERSPDHGETGERGNVPGLALGHDECVEFDNLVERTITVHRSDFDSGFIAESPAKLRRLPRYYRALAGEDTFPPVSCNAPWTSVVLEADGAVRPCFFHEPVGNVRESSLDVIVTGNLPVFRSSLVVGDNPVCRRCVCSLKTSWRNVPWRQ